jgi:hypothetical protein
VTSSGFHREPSPSAAPYPYLLPQRFSVYHTEEFKNRAQYMQLHSDLGMKALFKQLIKLYDMKNLEIRFYPFRKFEIGSLWVIISLSKLHLKPENHTSKTDWILVKKILILILFTLFRILMKNQIGLFKLKKLPRCLGSRKHKICPAHLEASPALLPPTCYIFSLARVGPILLGPWCKISTSTNSPI